MKKCPQCKQQNNDDAKLCSHCGSELDANENISVSEVDDFFDDLNIVSEMEETNTENNVEEFIIPAKFNQVTETNTENNVDELIVPLEFLEKHTSKHSVLSIDGKPISNNNDLHSIFEELKDKSVEVGNKIIDDNLSKEDAEYIKQKGHELTTIAETYVNLGNEVVEDIQNHIGTVKNNNRQKREEKLNEKYEDYENLAKRFGIDTEKYFLTNIKKYNVTGAVGRKNTRIDGFFGIEDGKFVFKEIGKRQWEKTIVGSLSIYFEHIVSLRLIKSLNDESSFEDITKVTAISLHDHKQVLKTFGERIKALRFKDFVSPADNKGMFNVLLINLVDNEYYEIRLPSIEIGEDIETLFDIWKKIQRNPKMRSNELSDVEQLTELGKLYKEDLISKNEYEIMKKKIIDK